MSNKNVSLANALSLAPTKLAVYITQCPQI